MFACMNDLHLMWGWGGGVGRIKMFPDYIKFVWK